ncbi:ninein isoform X2 [Synchiropus splendidus]|uniref:ninein isoform X2 n=1 Tax=Synchiropus splendidus TaxID=270530 RepID=UPI00237DE01D|nr:ninein isoform X2 [Synchiropus splendidus]
MEPLLGRLRCCGMEDAPAQDSYEEQLRQVFDGFDASGCGSLSSDELADLCLALHLDDAAPLLLDALLQDQDRLTSRVDFQQFKSALILVLSSPPAQQEPAAEPESAEIQPKFVKGTKRYGRRSTPEFLQPVSDVTELTQAAEGGEREESDESAVPRKRERWNAQEPSTEEFEAEGQMHLWNPDEPGTPRKPSAPLTARLQERVREACEHLSICWDGCASLVELLSLCEHLGLEINGDVIQSLNGEEVRNVQEFVSSLVSFSAPPTPSASTPYRQLKRLHSTQPFDDDGRRTANPSSLTCTIGTRLFSTLDDGTGFTAVEYLVDAWLDEGIENSSEILQALNFDLDGKLSLSDLTLALENELLVSKNGIHQAAVASFKAEIRYLLECVETEHREKEKLRSDLEKAERLKTQLAAEVDEHHSSIEQSNTLNLRKLEQEHREKLAAVRAQLSRELEQVQQQAALQREELEAQIHKCRDDESLLRDHLSVTMKENRRLEMEVLESSERIVELRAQVSKLHTSLGSVLTEKFGDLDPGSAEFLLQEERVRQLQSGYEARCRELQDRIDELQSELQELHTLAPSHTSCHRPLSEELESKSPGMESDPGIGSEEVHPFSLSLEAEMKLEQLREQHGREMELLRNQLENKINELNRTLESQGSSLQDQAAVSHQHQEELQGLREQLSRAQQRRDELQSQLEQAALERSHAAEKEAAELQQQEEMLGDLRLQLLEASDLKTGLEEQLKMAQLQKAAMESQLEELREQHRRDLATMESDLREKIAALEEDKKDFEKETALLRQKYEAELQAQLREADCKLEEERAKVEQELKDLWQTERAQLEERSNDLLQALLEDAMLKLVQEQEEKEKQWQSEKADLLQQHREAEERAQLQEELKQEWEEERLQLEEDYQAMLQERLHQERGKFEAEKQELEKALAGSLEEERARLEEAHREALQTLTTKHSEERNSLSITLRKLREDIAQERKEMESSFSQRLKSVEERFSGDHQSVEERFRADVLRLEDHYQSELQLLSESHARDKQGWEAQMQRALEISEEQRVKMETLEQDKGQQKQNPVTDFHKEEVEALLMSNQQLQEDKGHLITMAQTKEMELGRQLNDLHDRLQQSLQCQEELLARSIQKRMETELLLNQTVEDFQHERAELHKHQCQLELKYESQTAERTELLAERERLNMKIQELEVLLQQAVVDFELERQELQGCVSELQQRLAAVGVVYQEFAAEGDLCPEKTWVCQVEMKMEDEEGTVSASSQERKREALGLGSSRRGSCHEKETSGASVESRTEAPSVQQVSLETFHQDCSPSTGEGGVHESCDGGEPHQEASLNTSSPSQENKLAPELHEVVGAPSRLGETGGPGEPSGDDTELSSLASDSQELVEDSDCGSLCEHSTTKTEGSSHDGASETPCPAATEQNLLLHEKIVLLQQKNTVLQNVLAHKNERLRSGQQCVEDNLRLRVKLSLLLEHVRVLELQALQMAELQIRYEDCMCENAKLKEQNGELEQRVWSLESSWSLSPEADSLCSLREVSQLRSDNLRLSGMFAAFQASELQDQCPSLGHAPQAHSVKNSQLTEANQTLRKRILTLQEEDLKEKEQELLHALQDLDKEKTAAQQASESFHCQISELRLQSQNLEKENLVLSQRNAQNVAEMETLKLQLARVREEGPSARGLRQTAEEHRAASGRKSRPEKVKSHDETLHKQNARLRSELSAVQQQRDSLRCDVALLNKRLLSSSASKLVTSPQSQRQTRKHPLKQCKDSKAGALKKQEEPRHAGEPVPLLKALEQENAWLKQELESRTEVEDGGRELEKLRLENHELKEQLSRANSQAINALQGHFLGLLPSSPQRTPRGQRAEDPENLQEDREKRWKETEARMRETELSLHNVKLMLKEKVAQLNDQVLRNSRAAVLIRDVYAENARLLLVLETTEQRLKRTEKMNYLLEEKVSSLNKIVRRLNPVSLALMSHHSQ